MVRYHISQWRLGEDNFKDVRKAAEWAHAEYVVKVSEREPGRSPFLAYLSRSPAMSRPNKKQRPELQNPFPAHGGVVDDNAVLEVFAPLKLTQNPARNTSYYPHRLPAHIYSRLNSLLPKGGLKPFMQRHPDIFCVEAGVAGVGPKSWQFTLLASPIAQPANGGHAQAAAATFGQHTEPAAASDLMVSPPGLSN